MNALLSHLLSPYMCSLSNLFNLLFTITINYVNTVSKNNSSWHIVNKTQVLAKLLSSMFNKANIYFSFFLCSRHRSTWSTHVIMSNLTGLLWAFIPYFNLLTKEKAESRTGKRTKGWSQNLNLVSQRTMHRDKVTSLRPHRYYVSQQKCEGGLVTLFNTPMLLMILFKNTFKF